MNKPEQEICIEILDDETINQIAAGEVVERPASVVKELVENSIDAGAETIRVDVSSNKTGIIRIRVVDDGCGMEPDDAIISFTRHATSKVRTIDDLVKIHTMGFRGEALASIAAVSKVTMITRPRSIEPVPGTKIVMSGGESIEVTETGAPDGTTLMVEDLFFNTPARNKFLKSRQTEIAHIYTLMEHLALANRNISFRFSHNGKEKLSTSRTDNFMETIASVFGSEIVKELIPVSGKATYMQISGHVSKPVENRPNTNMIFISVNNRYVTSHPLAKAVRQGYGTLLPKGRYPVAFLNLTIDTKLVDVNVHPTKKEVRLSREKEIIREVANFVTESLDTHNLLGGLSGKLWKPQPVSGQQNSLTQQSPEEMTVASPEPVYTTQSRKPSKQDSYHPRFSTTDTQLRLTEPSSADQDDQSNKLPPMEILGQVDTAYIIAKVKNDEELIIIDQHAAHERILYDQICVKRDCEVKSQELLVPVIITLRPVETAVLHDVIPIMKEKGLIIEDFGKDTFVVRAVPMILGKRLGTELLQDIISDLMIGEYKSAHDKSEKITSTIACRAAIKAGAVLSHEQMVRLTDQLSRTKTPYTCPHGRPTIITVSRSRLDRIFSRT